MSVLNMQGAVDDIFKSTDASRTTTDVGSYVDGIWIPGTQTTTSFRVNIQPASQQEIDFLTQGGERVMDLRRVYVTDGPIETIDETGEWEFLEQRWKAVKVDNREKVFGNAYCKVIVARIDDQ